LCEKEKRKQNLLTLFNVFINSAKEKFSGKFMNMKKRRRNILLLNI